LPGCKGRIVIQQNAGASYGSGIENDTTEALEQGNATSSTHI
jgi:hypothetical protein